MNSKCKKQKSNSIIHENIELLSDFEFLNSLKNLDSGLAHELLQSHLTYLEHLNKKYFKQFNGKNEENLSSTIEDLSNIHAALNLNRKYLNHRKS